MDENRNRNRNRIRNRNRNRNRPTYNGQLIFDLGTKAITEEILCNKCFLYLINPCNKMNNSSYSLDELYSSLQVLNSKELKYKPSKNKQSRLLS